jgi:hypothetical protein
MLSCGLIDSSLRPPPPPLVVKLYFFLSLPACRPSSLLMGEGGLVLEPNHTTARKRGLL